MRIFLSRVSCALPYALSASLACLLVAGCVDLSTGSPDSGAPASTATSPDSGTASTTTTPMAIGANCGVEPMTGVTLCLAVSLCPNITIDTDMFPDCGFLIHQDVIDIECACSGALCPLGVPQTCADAQNMLAQQTQAQVCLQVNDGRCSGTAPAPSSAGTGSCDKDCQAKCGGDPSCFQLCGC